MRLAERHSSTVNALPGLREHILEEFVAEENVHLRHDNYPDAEKVREDDDTVRTSNKSGDLPPPYTPSEQAERRGPSPSIQYLLRKTTTIQLSPLPTTKLS
jgi:hypothetical protein